jgi:hypothetical protein
MREPRRPEVYSPLNLPPESHSTLMKANPVNPGIAFSPLKAEMNKACPN